MSAAAAATGTDQQAITAVIQQYMNGGIAGSSEVMSPAFHKDATIFGYLGPDFIGAPIQGLFDWVDQNPPASGLQGEIASINIESTIATVRVELHNWSGHRFTDMFTLLKVDGDWKIISKVFHLHAD